MPKLRRPIFMLPRRARYEEPSTYPEGYSLQDGVLAGDEVVRVWDTQCFEWQPCREIKPRQFWMYDHPAPTSWEWKYVNKEIE